MSYERWADTAITHALQHRRVAMLVGARQSGKTTLLKTRQNAHTEYRTLDDLMLLEAAQSDPVSFAKRQGRMMIIDEVQRAPNLLVAIKKAVDEDGSMGQYIITGSANIQQLPSVTESLAGRIHKIHLRTLAQGEINHHPPRFFNNAFDGRFENPETHHDKNHIIALALRGGYPEPLMFNHAERSSWHLDYLDALLDHDLNEIIHIQRRESLQQLMRILAAWSSQYMNLNSIQTAISIGRTTIQSYLNALEALFLIEQLPAWSSTDYDRVGKRSKFYMSDSGMMASILKWRHDDIHLDTGRVGKLVETFIYNELAANADSTGNVQLYHYRDREKREIDFLAQRDDGALLGIEVKASATIQRDHFKHLKWFHSHLAKPDHHFMGIVLYAGDQLLSFGDNMWAVPMGCLF